MKNGKTEKTRLPGKYGGKSQATHRVNLVAITPFTTMVMIRQQFRFSGDIHFIQHCPEEVHWKFFYVQMKTASAV